jgi:methionyl-tRNA synthetase
VSHAASSAHVCYRYNEVLERLHGGLRDLSVSRKTFDWGVPVPDMA